MHVTCTKTSNCKKNECPLERQWNEVGARFVDIFKLLIRFAFCYQFSTEFGK